MHAARVTAVVPCVVGGAVCVCVCVCVSVRRFLPPRASRPRNIGTYVFTATSKNNYYIIMIFAKNAWFRSYGVICLPRMPPTTLKPKRRIPKESAEGWKVIDSRDFKNASFRSYGTFTYVGT